tara:strand:+ start:2123 stop:2629 length:507 start_codon:yes stop_codon:yes gene_type:complete
MKSIEHYNSDQDFIELLLDSKIESNKWEQIITLDKYSKSYEKGFEKGVEAKSRADVFYLKHNLEFALNNAEKYVNHLENKYDILFEQMFLKICSPEEFSALIVVSPDSYFSSNMDKVYENLYTYLDAINESDKKLDIVFTVNGETVNEDKLTANGFILQFSKERARTS